jgi:C1A family cysteine protease
MEVNMSSEIKEIQEAIHKSGAKWTATETEFIKTLDVEQRGDRLGVVLDREALEKIRRQPPLDMAALIAKFEKKIGWTPERGDAAHIDAVRKRLELHLDIIFPPWFITIDWRNRKGRNNVTSVKDQGGCGSCVAFGTTATLESMLLIEHNVGLDLSEAELLNCGGGSCGGWWPDSAVSYLLSQGIAQESCFPYQPQNMVCTTCSERNGEAIQISNQITINDVVQRKQYIENIGPVMCVFEVFQDFYSYTGGIYSHVWGSSVGLHCVEVIGFNNFFGYWICKNSWGTGFGENGFFKIAFGECQIDTTFPFWGISGTKFFGT